MNPIRFNLVQNDTVGALTCYFNDQMFVADNTHANWQELVSAVISADDYTDLDAVARLFDPAAEVEAFFAKASERVSVSGGHVFFDGELMNDGLSNHIIAQIDEGNDPTPLVNFMENIMTNPNEHSRTQLFDWLSRRDFTITPEGKFLAYKGVRPRSKGDEFDLAARPFESISTGRAIVDGQVFSGAIPQGVGSVVEMPRGEVAWDPNVACHTGLHAGNFRYANSFAQGKLLLVEINPRDVVSVPRDSSSEKIRCCRYVVKDVIEQEITQTLWNDDDEDLDEDFSDDAPYEGDEEDSWEF